MPTESGGIDRFQPLFVAQSNTKCFQIPSWVGIFKGKTYIERLNVSDLNANPFNLSTTIKAIQMSDKDDHWGKLLTDFGLGKVFGKREKKSTEEATVESDEIKDVQPEADSSEQTDNEVKIGWDDDEVAGEAEENPQVAETSSEISSSEIPASEIPASVTDSPPATTGVAHWDDLAGELGVEVTEEPSKESSQAPVAEVTPSTAPSSSSTSVAPAFEIEPKQENPLDEMFVADSRDERLDFMQAGASEIGFSSFDEPEEPTSESEAVNESEASDSDGPDKIQVVVEDLDLPEGKSTRRRRRRSRTRRTYDEPIEEEQNPEAEASSPQPEQEVSGDRQAEEESDAKRPKRSRRRRSRGRSSERESDESSFAESSSDKDSIEEKDTAASERKGRSRRRRTKRDDDERRREERDVETGDTRRRRPKGKKIPGWLDCVGVMIDANIERHKKSSGERKRNGGKSRGRRGGSGRNRN